MCALGWVQFCLLWKGSNKNQLDWDQVLEEAVSLTPSWQAQQQDLPATPVGEKAWVWGPVHAGVRPLVRIWPVVLRLQRVLVLGGSTTLRWLQHWQEDSEWIPHWLFQGSRVRLFATGLFEKHISSQCFLVLGMMNRFNFFYFPFPAPGYSQWSLPLPCALSHDFSTP